MSDTPPDPPPAPKPKPAPTPAPAEPTPATGKSSRTPAAAKAHVQVSKLLRTGLLDWAVTNKDTEDIHAVLAGLAPSDWQAVMLRLARTEEAAGKNLLTKYLMRGVTDHSEGQCKLFSAQVSEKIYGPLAAIPADEDEETRAAALASAQSIEKGLRALAGAKLWDYARQGAADAAR